MRKAAINFHVNAFVCVFISPGSGISGLYVKSIFNIKRKTFPKVLHSHQQPMRASLASHPLQNLILSVLLNLAILVFVQW